MSDLPKERCCKAVLFTQCGVVMFGPVTIRERERERRTNPKQYCALFTCSASTAFHIEVTCTMETAFSTLCVDSWQDEAKHDQ